MNLFGSICLSEIPKELIKKVACKDGKTRMFLNVNILELRNPRTFSDRTYTHAVKCYVKRGEEKEGVNYFIGDLETSLPASHIPSAEDIEAAPSVDAFELPF